MSNSIFKRMLDKVRFVTQRKQVSETYFMDEKQVPLMTEEVPTIEEETVSTKEERSLKINSGGSKWSPNTSLMQTSAIFTKGLPKGDTITVKHFK